MNQKIIHKINKDPDRTNITKVDCFNAYYIYNGIFIKGKMKIHFSMNEDELFSDYIEFIDEMDQIEIDILKKKFQLKIPCMFLRSLLFYEDTKFLEDPNIVTTNINENTPSDKKENEPQSLSYSTLFCKIYAHFPNNEKYKIYDDYCIYHCTQKIYKHMNFIFMLSKEKCWYFINRLKNLYPLVDINNKSNSCISNCLKSSKEPNTDIVLTLTFEKISKYGFILTDILFSKIIEFLPKNILLNDISLIYSTQRDGIHLQTLYNQVNKKQNYLKYPPTLILLIKDSNKNIFGSILTDIPHINNVFSGTSNSAVFKCENNDIKVFKSSGKNSFYQMGHCKGFLIGSDNGKSAIFFGSDMKHGLSEPCSTFDSPQLSYKREFIIYYMEIWGFEK